MTIIEEKCAPNPALLSSTERDLLLTNILHWQYDSQKKIIFRSWKFANFHEVMAFINAIAWIAHREDHHPDVSFSYNICTVTFQTHTLKDVSRNDLICAAKINALSE